jgi:hypothetical protein
MSQTITLNLPDSLFQPLQRTAQATKQPVETLLLSALQASLPSLEGLSPEMRENLTGLELLDDDALWQVMLETVPEPTQRKLRRLLARNQTSALSPAEQMRLDELQQAADLVMLRKARAAVLLRFRGRRVPTLAELSELAANGKHPR